MKRFFQRIGEAMQRFMTGRYGYDELGHDLNIVAIVLLILSLFETLRPLNLFAMALWLWVVFRMYSRKTHKRMIERDHYLRWRKKIAGRFSTAKRAWSDRKTHRYFRCKSCGAVLRVPKGKGKITVTCPQCGNEITKKTDHVKRRSICSAMFRPISTICRKRNRHVTVRPIAVCAAHWASGTAFPPAWL